MHGALKEVIFSLEEEDLVGILRTI